MKLLSVIVGTLLIIMFLVIIVVALYLYDK